MAFYKLHPNGQPHACTEVQKWQCLKNAAPGVKEQWPLKLPNSSRYIFVSWSQDPIIIPGNKYLQGRPPHTHLFTLPFYLLFRPSFYLHSTQMCKAQGAWEYLLSINYGSRSKQPEDFESLGYKMSVIIKSKDSSWHLKADGDWELTPVGTKQTTWIIL